MEWEKEPMISGERLHTLQEKMHQLERKSISRSERRTWIARPPRKQLQVKKDLMSNYW